MSGAGTLLVASLKSFLKPLFDLSSPFLLELEVLASSAYVLRYAAGRATKAPSESVTVLVFVLKLSLAKGGMSNPNCVGKDAAVQHFVRESIA